MHHVPVICFPLVASVILKLGKSFLARLSLYSSNFLPHPPSLFFTLGLLRVFVSPIDPRGPCVLGLAESALPFRGFPAAFPSGRKFAISSDLSQAPHKHPHISILAAYTPDEYLCKYLSA
ncbi:hypothetical protein B0H13DRAFT_2650159 [Mycena leptocephala]|nr:hypothetical protein B0H13DRAFT_2650159 [Mycena leptocephala]